MPVLYSYTTFLPCSQIAVPWKSKLPSAEAGDRFSWDVVSLFLFSQFLTKCRTYPKVYITYADLAEQWQNIYLNGDSFVSYFSVKFYLWFTWDMRFCSLVLSYRVSLLLSHWKLLCRTLHIYKQRMNVNSEIQWCFACAQRTSASETWLHYASANPKGVMGL